MGDRVAELVEQLPGHAGARARRGEPHVGGLGEVDAEVVGVAGRVDRGRPRPVQLQRQRRCEGVAGLLAGGGPQPVRPLRAGRGGDFDVVGAGCEHAPEHGSAGPHVKLAGTGHGPAAGVLQLDGQARGDQHVGLLAEREREVVLVGGRVDGAVLEAAQAGGPGVGSAGRVGVGGSLDHVGARDPAVEARAVAGDPHVVGAWFQRLHEQEVPGAVGQGAVVVLREDRAVVVEQFSDGVEAAAGGHDHFGRGGELEPEVVGVGAGRDRSRDRGVQRQRGGRGDGVAVVDGRALHGGGPLSGAGRHGAHLHVVAGAVGGPGQGVDQRARRPSPLVDGPQGVCLVGGAGLDVAQVEVPDRVRAGKAPLHRERPVAGDDRVDGRHARRLRRSVANARGQQARQRDAQHDAHQCQGWQPRPRPAHTGARPPARHGSASDPWGSPDHHERGRQARHGRVTYR